MQIQEIIIILLICIIVYLLYNKSNNMPNYTPKNLSTEMFNNNQCNCLEDYEPLKCPGRDEPYKNKCEAMCAGEDMSICDKYIT